MNRKRILSMLLSVGLWLTGCTDEPGHHVDNIAVTFTSGIEGTGGVSSSTRASDGSWSADDRVGIYMVPHNSTPGAPANVSGALATNVQYKAASGGASTALEPVGSIIAFPGDGSQVNFVSYYPYNNTLHTAHSHVYPIDVSTQDPLSAIDLLYHKGEVAYSRTSTSVPLNFTHQLSKFIITVAPASGVTADLSTATASLTGFPSRASFSLSTGDLSNVTTTTATLAPVKEVDASTDSKAIFTAILVPHEGTGYTGRTVTMRINNQDYSYILPTTRNFTSGTAYAYDFTFTGDKVVLAQNTIVDWDGGTIAWGDNLLTCNKTVFNLPPTASSNNTITLSTTSMANPTFALSTAANEITTAKPSWITNTTIVKGTTANGWINYTLTFSTTKNTYDTSRTGYIHLELSGLTIVIRVSQAEAPYLNGPVPASFTFESGSQSNKSFTVTTNLLEPTATLSYSLNGTTKVGKPSWITVNAPVRTTNGAGVSTFTTTFSVSENTSTTTSRTCYIHISVEGLEKSVRIDQGTVFGSTNCHMIAPGTNIRIPVTRAVTLGGMSSSASFTAVKLWDDNNVVSSVGVEGSGSSGYITITANSASRQGNALVALKVGSTIYWSWHIWVTTYNPNPSTTSNSWTYNGYTFMDRNLGATDNTFSVASRGLFYQWGRKDPMPATDITGFSKVKGPVDQQTAHRNPDKFYYNGTSPNNWLSSQVDNLWGHNTTKTVFDPCPAGWRVPSFKNGVSPWNGLTDSNFPWQGTGCQYGSTATSRHPAAGWRSRNNGSLSGVGAFGCCWSASPSSTYAYGLNFDFSSYVVPSGVDDRASGRSVRCVRE